MIDFGCNEDFEHVEYSVWDFILHILLVEEASM